MAPLALVGTAVAFPIGFQNNAAYGRAREARKVWGGIGSTNDVPLSTISRGIEIDLREINEEPPSQIPPPLESVHNVQM